MTLQDPVAEELLVAACRTGKRLQVARLPASVLPAVLLLAHYAKHYATRYHPLVDDYPRLVERYRNELGYSVFVFKWMASVIARFEAIGQRVPHSLLNTYGLDETLAFLFD
jgi:hypothetical protein